MSLDAENSEAAKVAMNLRRLMVRDGLTFDEVVSSSGLDERTVRSLARGASHPQAKTLHKLATGLGVPVEELFRPPGRFAPRQFDRETNPVVEGVLTQHASLFDGWDANEFEELYSRFGTGGQLTEAGVLAAAEAMNTKRDLWRQISIILESSESEVFAEFVELLYRRATLPKDRFKNGVARIGMNHEGTKNTKAMQSECEEH